MQTKRIATIVTTVIVLALLLATSSTVAAPPVEGGEGLGKITLAGTVASKISYQGRLTDAGGTPLSGNYNLVFQLWDDASGGSQVGGDIVRNNVPVSNGLFTVDLDVPHDAFNGQALWLRIQVNGQWLTPRQELLPVPYALSLTPGAAISASIYDGPVLKVENTDANPAGGGYAIVGKNASGNTWRPAIYGENTGASAGVYGRSNGWHATVGWQAGSNPDHAGVYGYNAGAGPGVYGQSPNGDGVHGQSSSGDGVVGEASASNKSGVFALNTGAGYGVVGRSVNGWGVEASGNDTSNSDRVGDLVLAGNIGEIFSFGHLGIYADHDVYIDLDDDNNDANAKFVIFDGTNAFRLTVDENGNLWASGTKSATVETANYGQRLLYTVESPGVWFEDFGKASLVNGEATVAFEPIFAETVNLEADYHVFLTPLCQEPVLLFVTAKNTKGFTVRGVALNGQPTGCAFDYRIVAKRLGYEQVRLEEATWPEEGKER